MNLRRTIRRRHAAYTMVELMAAVLISIVLVVAMYQIFARVQSVFTTGHSRTKLLEEGRAVMDLIVRDLSRMAPAGLLLESIHTRRPHDNRWLIDSSRVANRAKRMT